MTTTEAIVLGIVQGLTEFLPISSTAHLRIVPELAGWSDPGPAFSAVIQLGTLVAVMAFFRRDISRIALATIRGILTGQPIADPDAKLGWMIVLGTIPIVVFGLALKHHIESTLRSLYVIAVSLLVMSLILGLAEWLHARQERRGKHLKSLGDLSWLDSLLVGLAQALALLPGASRSGVTISAGLFQGFTRETAARFSFLLSLPSVFAAGMLEMYKERKDLLASHDDVANLIIATVVSAVVGYAAIAGLIGYLRRHSTWLFIYYRIALAILLLALLRTGHLSPGGQRKAEMTAAPSDQRLAQ